jgi:L-iditol 2-dehydrogenase
MKVAVYHRNDDIRIEERAVPLISGGEILVKMKASGICGTDVMEWYRIKKAPRILGHEMSGEIIDIGKGVDRFEIGDRVFVSHHVPCYSCHYCQTGNVTACETLHSGNYDPGGFSEYIRVPEQNVKFGTLVLPDSVTFEDATMIEPLGCVIAGQRQAGILETGQPDGKTKTILVIGSGISGLLHIKLSKLHNARVIATDINDYRLDKALQFGADHVFNAREYSAERLRDVNNGFLSDIVIVCAGVEQAVEHAVSSVDRKGRLLFFAVPETGITFPALRFWRNEISLAFSYGAAPEDLEKSLEMIRSNKVNVRDMITDSVPFSSIQQGFRLVAGAKDSLKVVVVPDPPA